MPYWLGIENPDQPLPGGLNPECMGQWPGAGAQKEGKQGPTWGGGWASRAGGPRVRPMKSVVPPCPWEASV